MGWPLAISVTAANKNEPSGLLVLAITDIDARRDRPRTWLEMQKGPEVKTPRSRREQIHFTPSCASRPYLDSANPCAVGAGKQPAYNLNPCWRAGYGSLKAAPRFGAAFSAITSCSTPPFGKTAMEMAPTTASTNTIFIAMA